MKMELYYPIYLNVWFSFLNTIISDFFAATNTVSQYMQYQLQGGDVPNAILYNQQLVSWCPILLGHVPLSDKVHIVYTTVYKNIKHAFADLKMRSFCRLFHICILIEFSQNFYKSDLFFVTFWCFSSLLNNVLMQRTPY